MHRDTAVPQPIHRATLAVDPLDLSASMEMQLLGRFDPTGTCADGAFLKAHIDAGGRPATWRFTRTAAGLRIELQADHPAALHAFTSRFPTDDGAAAFRPAHPVLARLARLRGLRLGCMPWPWDVAAGAVLQQRVRWREGYNDFRRIAMAWGERIGTLRAFPCAARLAGVPAYRLESLGIDGKRARTLIALATAQASHQFLRPDARLEDVRARLLSLPGIGPWTTGLVLGYGYGDPDAVPVGDLHIPSIVTFALAGEPVGTDERMLELLEPVRGQRFRAIRLILWAIRKGSAPWPHTSAGTGTKKRGAVKLLTAPRLDHGPG